MKTMLILLALVMTSAPARAMNVFACEPEWGALVTALAGDRAEVTVATTAFQDPHTLQARPSLLAAIRQADLLVCTGADLEIGWLPLLLRRAGGAGIQPGKPAHFLAADYVRKLEVPTRVDRSQGDIHPQGNPHVHLNPHNIARIADQLSARLAELDPAAAADYATQLADFRQRWDRAIAGWEERGERLAGMRLVSHHRSFSYLADWLDLQIVATLEPQPGIPPSGAHLSRLLERLSSQPPAAIIRTPYANEKPSLWLAERVGAPAVVLPYTIGGAPGATDLFGLFDVTLDALEVANQ